MVTVIIVLLGAVGAVASLSDRIVLTREYIPHIQAFQQHQKDAKEERKYIRTQLDEIQRILLGK